ncbi:hypothetical protein PENSPDRAFT_690590 [Peniophora sp. CONT]|nr:hypothetical protein PENSPDRAFT_690590 [Peniophora sp. CONT]
MSSDPQSPVGEEFLLRLDDGRSLAFVVEKAYEPFSKAVVLLARCDDLSSSSSYMTNGTHRPWTWEAEAAAGEHREPLQWNSEYDDKKSKDYFEAELGAYDKLVDLQGTVIPRLFGVGYHVPSDRHSYTPHALVLEFIDGMTISAAPASALTPSIMSQLYQDIQLLNPRGVIHNDLKNNNIIISSSRQRAVIFYFGSACVRCDNESDEEWAGDLTFDYDETGVVAVLLWEKRIQWRPDFQIPFYSFSTA